jgi:hypothetical protein
MATPPSTPVPPEPAPTAPVRLRVSPRDGRPPVPPRRPPRELPPVSQLQRYLDLSG